MTLFRKKHEMCVLAVSCLAITILSSCGDLQDETPDPEILDLFEVFFRYKFENNASAQKQDAEAYFLEIEGEDPSPEFLARFKGHSPPVKKGSEFVMGGSIVIEGEVPMEGNGLLFRIDNYKWIGLFGNCVKISGGYSEGDLSASWASYIWMRRKGKWELEFIGDRAIA
ncbi:MAG: hypothetical protein OXI63_18820 [Candidatus Poribacteria bacterium]|nr:hypothetical protein [Candidatus Poribacteria bacterium]